MKSNKLKISAIILVAIVLIQLITSYCFGFLLESNRKDELKSLENIQLLKVNNITYKRNIFSTDIDLDTSLDLQKLNSLYGISLSESNADSKTRVRMHMQHGLFTGIFHGYLMPTLAFGQVTIKYPSMLSEKLDKIFNNKEPLKITRLIYLNKTVKDYMIIAEGSYTSTTSNSKISWKQISLIGKSNKNREDIKFKINMPLLDMKTNDLSMVVTDFKGNINQNYGKWKFMPTGDSRYRADTVKINIAGTKEDPAGLELTLNNPSYRDTTLEKNNFIDMQELIKIKKIIVKTAQTHEKFKDIRIDFSFNHLAAKPLDQLIESINQWSSNDADSTSEKSGEVISGIFKPLKPNFAELLINKPEFNLHNASIKIPEISNKDDKNKQPGGEIKVTSNLKLNNFIASDLDDFNQLQKKILFEMKIIVPQAMLPFKGELATYNTKFIVNDKIGEMKISYVNGQLLINDKLIDESSTSNGK